MVLFSSSASTSFSLSPVLESLSSIYLLVPRVRISTPLSVSQTASRHAVLLCSTSVIVGLGVFLFHRIKDIQENTITVTIVEMVHLPVVSSPPLFLQHRNAAASTAISPALTFQRRVREKTPLRRSRHAALRLPLRHRYHSRTSTYAGRRMEKHPHSRGVRYRYYEEEEEYRASVSSKTKRYHRYQKQRTALSQHPGESSSSCSSHSSLRDRSVSTHNGNEEEPQRWCSPFGQNAYMKQTAGAKRLQNTGRMVERLRSSERSESTEWRRLPRRTSFEKKRRIGVSPSLSSTTTSTSSRSSNEHCTTSRSRSLLTPRASTVEVWQQGGVRHSSSVDALSSLSSSRSSSAGKERRSSMLRRKVDEHPRRGLPSMMQVDVYTSYPSSANPALSSTADNSTRRTTTRSHMEDVGGWGVGAEEGEVTVEGHVLISSRMAQSSRFILKLMTTNFEWSEEEEEEVDWDGRGEVERRHAGRQLPLSHRAPRYPAASGEEEEAKRTSRTSIYHRLSQRFLASPSGTSSMEFPFSFYAFPSASMKRSTSRERREVTRDPMPVRGHLLTAPSMPSDALTVPHRHTSTNRHATSDPLSGHGTRSGIHYPPAWNMASTSSGVKYPLGLAPPHFRRRVRIPEELFPHLIHRTPPAGTGIASASQRGGVLSGIQPAPSSFIGDGGGPIRSPPFFSSPSPPLIIASPAASPSPLFSGTVVVSTTTSSLAPRPSPRPPLYPSAVPFRCLMDTKERPPFTFSVEPSMDDRRDPSFQMISREATTAITRWQDTYPTSPVSSHGNSRDDTSGLHTPSRYPSAEPSGMRTYAPFAHVRHQAFEGDGREKEAESGGPLWARLVTKGLPHDLRASRLHSLMLPPPTSYESSSSESRKMGTVEQVRGTRWGHHSLLWRRGIQLRLYKLHPMVDRVDLERHQCFSFTPCCAEEGVELFAYHTTARYRNPAWTLWRLSTTTTTPPETTGRLTETSNSASPVADSLCGPKKRHVMGPYFFLAPEIAPTVCGTSSTFTTPGLEEGSEDEKRDRRHGGDAGTSTTHFVSAPPSMSSSVSSFLPSQPREGSRPFFRCVMPSRVRLLRCRSCSTSSLSRSCSSYGASRFSFASHMITTVASGPLRWMSLTSQAFFQVLFSSSPFFSSSLLSSRFLSSSVPHYFRSSSPCGPSRCIDFYIHILQEVNQLKLFIRLPHRDLRVVSFNAEGVGRLYAPIKGKEHLLVWEVDCVDQHTVRQVSQYRQRREEERRRARQQEKKKKAKEEQQRHCGEGRKTVKGHSNAQKTCRRGLGVLLFGPSFAIVYRVFPIHQMLAYGKQKVLGFFQWCLNAGYAWSTVPKPPGTRKQKDHEIRSSRFSTQSTRENEQKGGRRIGARHSGGNTHATRRKHRASDSSSLSSSVSSSSSSFFSESENDELEWTTSSMSYSSEMDHVVDKYVKKASRTIPAPKGQELLILHFTLTYEPMSSSLFTLMACPSDSNGESEEEVVETEVHTEETMALPWSLDEDGTRHTALRVETAPMKEQRGEERWHQGPSMTSNMGDTNKEWKTNDTFTSDHSALFSHPTRTSMALSPPPSLALLPPSSSSLNSLSRTPFSPPIEEGKLREVEIQEYPPHHRQDPEEEKAKVEQVREKDKTGLKDYEGETTPWVSCSSTSRIGTREASDVGSTSSVHSSPPSSMNADFSHTSPAASNGLEEPPRRIFSWISFPWKISSASSSPPHVPSTSSTAPSVITTTTLEATPSSDAPPLQDLSLSRLPLAIPRSRHSRAPMAVKEDHERIPTVEAPSSSLPVVSDVSSSFSSSSFRSVLSESQRTPEAPHVRFPLAASTTVVSEPLTGHAPLLSSMATSAIDESTPSVTKGIETTATNTEDPYTMVKQDPRDRKPSCNRAGGTIAVARVRLPCMHFTYQVGGAASGITIRRLQVASEVPNWKPHTSLDRRQVWYLFLFPWISLHPLLKLQKKMTWMTQPVTFSEVQP